MKNTLMLLKLICLMPLFFILHCRPAYSFEPHFILGGKGGYQFTQDDSYNHNGDPSREVFGLFSGYQFTPQLSVEGGYQNFGDLDAKLTSVTINTSLFELAARYDFYIKDSLSLYGRLGGAYWHMAKHPPSVHEISAYGFSPMSELGISYNLTSNLKASFGYQYIDKLGDSKTRYYDSHSVMFNIAYSFKNNDFSTLNHSSENINTAHSKEGANQLKPINKHLYTVSLDVCNFKFDSAVLNDKCDEKLREILPLLFNHPISSVTIQGHTDWVGTRRYNRQLSMKRAESIARFLHLNGVDVSRLFMEGKMDTEPKESNETVDGRAANRRAVLILKSPEEINYE